jgi:hypothetical protein
MRNRGSHEFGQWTRQQLEDRLNELELDYELAHEGLTKGRVANYEVIVILVVAGILGLVRSLHRHLSLIHYLIGAAIVIIALTSKAVVMRIRDAKLIAEIEAVEDALANIDAREGR